MHKKNLLERKRKNRIGHMREVRPGNSEYDEGYPQIGQPYLNDED